MWLKDSVFVFNADWNSRGHSPIQLQCNLTYSLANTMWHFQAFQGCPYIGTLHENTHNKWTESCSGCSARFSPINFSIFMQSFLTRASIKTLEIPHSCTQVIFGNLSRVEMGKESHNVIWHIHPGLFAQTIHFYFQIRQENSFKAVNVTISLPSTTSIMAETSAGKCLWIVVNSNYWPGLADLIVTICFPFCVDGISVQAYKDWLHRNWDPPSNRQLRVSLAKVNNSFIHLYLVPKCILDFIRTNRAIKVLSNNMKLALHLKKLVVTAWVTHLQVHTTIVLISLLSNSDLCCNILNYIVFDHNAIQEAS